MDDNQKLIKEIEKLESQLYKAAQESDAWNDGKYKTSLNAEVSKIYENSLRESIKKHEQKLSVLQNKETK